MPGVDELAFSLAAVSARLKEAGDGGLARELSRGIGKAVDPVEGEIRAGLAPRLPDPYAEVLNEDLRISRRTTTADFETRVTISATTRGTQRRRLKRLDDGILAHPLWGSRRHWYDQPVRGGWFTGPAEDTAPRAREEIERAVNEVAAKAAGKGA